jgi:Fe-S-cluster containining protein
MTRTADEAIYLILNLTRVLAEAQDLDTLYEAIGFGSDLVFGLYPHIDCHTGCNRCCRNNSLPIVSPLEWQRVYEGVALMPESAKAELVERTLDWHRRLGASLWQLHDHLQTPTSMDKIEAITQVLETFQDCACPFLANGRCSNYDHRPAKCRAHGAFLMRFEQEVQMHTCAEEVDKMEAYLAKQGSRRVAMPFWNPAEDRLNQLNGPGVTSTVLPLWLLAHIDDGRLAAEVNLKPDWADVRRRFPPTV